MAQRNWYDLKLPCGRYRRVDKHANSLEDAQGGLLLGTYEIEVCDEQSAKHDEQTECLKVELFRRAGWIEE